AVGEQLNVMRLHAAGRKFADLPVAVGRVADADDALRVGVIVLGGVEQLAVGGEGAMAEEMPVGLGAEPGRRPAIGGHGDTKTSGPAGEGDPFVCARAQSDVVTALGQLNRANIAAVEREQSRGVTAAIVAARGGEQLHVSCGLGAMPRKAESQGATAQANEKLAAIEVHAQSPSMA